MDRLKATGVQKRLDTFWKQEKTASTPHNISLISETRIEAEFNLHKGIPVNNEDKKVLDALEAIFGQKLPVLDMIDSIPKNTFGVTILNENVSGLFLTKYSLRGFIPIKKFPMVICNLAHLEIFEWKFALIEELPGEIDQLSELEIFRFAHNSLQKLPRRFFNLSKLTDLDLSYNRLEEFDSDNFHFNNLISLDLTHNNLQEISPQLIHCKMLRIADLSSNQLMTLPEKMDSLISLEILDLHSNQLTVDAIRNFTPPPSLNHLYLFENHLCTAAAIPVLQPLQARLWIFLTHQDHAYDIKGRSRFCPHHEKLMKIRKFDIVKSKGWVSFSFYCPIKNCPYSEEVSPGYQRSADNILEQKNFSSRFGNAIVKVEECPPHDFIMYEKGNRFFKRCCKCNKHYHEIYN